MKSYIFIISFLFSTMYIFSQKDTIGIIKDSDNDKYISSSEVECFLKAHSKIRIGKVDTILNANVWVGKTLGENLLFVAVCKKGYLTFANKSGVVYSAFQNLFFKNSFLKIHSITYEGHNERGLFNVLAKNQIGRINLYTNETKWSVGITPELPKQPVGIKLGGIKASNTFIVLEDNSLALITRDKLDYKIIGLTPPMPYKIDDNSKIDFNNKYNLILLGDSILIKYTSDKIINIIRGKFRFHISNISVNGMLIDCFSKSILKFDIDTGEIIWKKKFKNFNPHYEIRPYTFIGEKGIMQINSLNGDILKIKEFDWGKYLHIPNKNQFIFICRNGVYKIDSTTLKLIWKKEIYSDDRFIINQNTSNGLYYNNGQICKIDFQSGKVLWQSKKIIKNDSVNEVKIDIYDDGLIKFASYRSITTKGSIYASISTECYDHYTMKIDTTNGEITWKNDLFGFKRYDNFLLRDENADSVRIISLNLKTGDIIWNKVLKNCEIDNHFDPIDLIHKRVNLCNNITITAIDENYIKENPILYNYVNDNYYIFDNGKLKRDKND